MIKDIQMVLEDFEEIQFKYVCRMFNVTAHTLAMHSLYSHRLYLVLMLDYSFIMTKLNSFILV